MLKTQLKVRVWARTQFQSKYAARVLGRGTKRRATTTVAWLGANTKGTREVIPLQNRPVPTQPKTRQTPTKPWVCFGGFTMGYSGSLLWILTQGFLWVHSRYMYTWVYSGFMHWSVKQTFKISFILQYHRL